MPIKKTKRCKRVKKCNQVGGWFWERDDPIFGASNRWIGDNVITPANNFLKKTQVLSKIAGPVGSFFGGPAGGIAGGLVGAALHSQGYGRHRLSHCNNHSSFNCIKK